jgi:hypothetical protein
MGTSLNGLNPASTYQALIKVGNNTNLNTTLKTLSDGAGNDLPMQASTAGVNFTGTLSQSGTAVPTAAEVAAKQDTLVSGTNIKTINGTSVLGSGNIAVVTSPSGVAGAIQFSAGSAFNSDAANLFWDDTNNRLGIGTNAPAYTFDLQSTSADPLRLKTTASYFRAIFQNAGSSGIFDFNSSNFQFPTNSVDFGTSTALGARVGIKGSGSTSATTSLLVQNSAGTEAFRINDGLVATFANNVNASNFIGNIRSDSYLTADGGFFALRTSSTGNSRLPQSVAIGTSSEPAASAALDIVSTTKGVLFPRMTTTQKNAITAVAGLVVYDSTTNKLCCYNGSTWNDLF